MIKIFKNVSLLSAISFACAIHCILTPFLLMFVPFLGHYFDNIWIEILLLSLSITSGTWVIFKGYRTHKKTLNLFLFGSGSCLWLIHFLIEHSGLAGATFPLAMGSLLILYSFYMNHTLLSQNKDDNKKCCTHLHH